MTKILCGECIHNSDKGGGCLIPKNLGYVDNCNHYLPKDRPIVQTNEEWFCQLSTEEKAKVFANATYSTAETPLTILWGGKEAEQKKWEMWLKQPHGGDGE